MESELKRKQLQSLHELTTACTKLNLRLMLEMIIPDEFPANGKNLSISMETV